MTWKQFWKLAILTNILIIGGLWLAGYIVDGLPAAKLLGRTLIISALAIFVITAGLLLFSHITLFVRAKWRGELPKGSQSEKWAFYVFLAFLTFFFLALVGIWLEPSTGNDSYFEHFAAFGFWGAAVTGLVLLALTLHEVLGFRSIGSALQ